MTGQDAGGGVRLRPGQLGDASILRDITEGAEGHGGSAEAEPSAPGAAYFEQLLAHARVLVAEVGGEPVAFGATVDTARSRHLADLFVRPPFQGRGIGRRLLGVLFDVAGARTTFASDDPRALPLYVAFGMRPLWSNLYLAGEAARLPAPRPGLLVDDVRAGLVAALEREWTGIDRPQQHHRWAGQPGSRALVVRAGAERLATGYAHRRLRKPGSWLANLIVAPGVEPTTPTLAALHFAGEPDGRVGACVPGPHPILPLLLAGGFRIFDHDTFMASAPDLVDPERLLPDASFL